MTAEVQYLLPDILALQEVDHIADFEQNFAALGYAQLCTHLHAHQAHKLINEHCRYQGAYSQRGGKRYDGCAIFW